MCLSSAYPEVVRFTHIMVVSPGRCTSRPQAAKTPGRERAASPPKLSGGRRRWGAEQKLARPVRSDHLSCASQRSTTRSLPPRQIAKCIDAQMALLVRYECV